jgi:predicted nuclease with TOPRIM domain
MSVDERALLALHRRLDDVLGTDEAATLMSQLPLTPATELLTKEDGRRFDARFTEIDHRFDRVEERLDRVEERLDRVEVRLDRLEDRMDRFETRMMAKLSEEFAHLDDRVDSAISKAMRQTVVGTIGVILATAATVLTAVQLG